MKFGYREKRDLLFAGTIISLAFAILNSGGFEVFSSLNFLSTGFLIIFLASFVTAGLGFLLHELAHKSVAQNYGLRAEFRAFYGMLWLALGFSFLGFIIAAPGAVFIYGMISREKNGKISVAGPITNIVLAILFLVGFIILGEGNIFGEVSRYGLIINSLLAAFNMIPVMPLDGAKVLAWNKLIYSVTVVVAVGLFLLSFFI